MFKDYNNVRDIINILFTWLRCHLLP